MSDSNHVTGTLAEDQVLNITDLSIQFGGLKAVEGLSFYVKGG